MDNNQVLSKIGGGLIVSCQALEHEPLHSSYIMGRMAYAAMLGGASGIRSNSVEDIKEIRSVVDLPVIGIIKRVYEGYEDLYITPTIKEIEEVAGAGAEIIAFDATKRPRPGKLQLDELFREAKRLFPDKLFMADCSEIGEGLHAYELGFDLVGTTLSSYTPYTKGRSIPDLDLIGKLSAAGARVVGEGGIWVPEQLNAAYEAGAFTCVVGTAITRPMEITQRFVKALKGEDK